MFRSILRPPVSSHSSTTTRSTSSTPSARSAPSTRATISRSRFRGTDRDPARRGGTLGPVRLLPRTAAALATILALVGAGAGPATAQHGGDSAHGHPRTIDVVNMGDSISAGIGSGEVVNSPVLEPCLQGSGRNHVDRLTSHRRFDLLLDAACGGLTTDQVEVLAGDTMVAAALDDAELVTLTMGANDVRYWDFIEACGWTGDSRRCDALVAEAPARIAAAAASAGKAHATIDDLTDATVVHLGYPHLFDGEAGNAWLSAARATQLNHLTDVLNAALARAARAQGATFVDVTRRFDGHGADSRRPWIYFNPDDTTDLSNLHPNTRGYLWGYYPALRHALGHVLKGR